MKKLGRLVLLGLMLSMLLAGLVPGDSGLAAQEIGATTQHCYLGCCLRISGWCVWHCTVCEDLPVGQ